MIKFFKAFPKFVKTAFLNIFRHIAMSISAMSAVTITLILFSSFLMIAGNVSLFTNTIEDDLRIHVVLDKNIDTKKEIDKVESELKKISGVSKAEFSDKDAELELYIKEKGEEFEMYRGEDNPLTHAFFVSVKDADQIESINAKVEDIAGVRQSVYGGSSVSQLISILNAIRSGGLVFVVLLMALALFLISNSIKLTIYARNTEISIMRNVGAANWYIKVPFMIEGMMIGFFGAIIPCIFTYFGYEYLYGLLNGHLVSAVFNLQPVMPFTLQIGAILIGSGMLVGLIGSFFSTTRYLHWKR